MKKFLTIAAIVLGLCFIALAAYYWLTPAGSLPHYLPGFEANSTHVHLKHGVASVLLGLALLVFAWFNSGPERASAAAPGQ